MRNAKRNSLSILCASVTLSLLILFHAIRLMASANVADVTPLEKIIGNSNYAIGNNFGSVYSITGEELVIEQNGKKVSISNFTNIIGNESGGLIYQCKPILLANDAQINRLQRQGNNIITTLHPAGQATAVQLLSEYDVENIEASITFVLRDGTVLVSAGNNSYTEGAYAEAEIPRNLYVDYSTSAKEKGSCFKPVIYRMLLKNTEYLPSNLDITGDSFEDISYVTINGNTTHNWDWGYPSYYESNNNGLYTRYCSLSELLQRSSNTAPLRCAKALGFKESYEQLCQMYGIDRPLITEINTISGVSLPSERLPWLFFGQDACLSPVRMCQLYNHLVSGRFYSPYYVVGITQPNGNMIYKASPTEKVEYHMDINVKQDILNNALEDTFESYLTNNLRTRYPEELLTSRRLLAKSGTAENADGTENRTIMLTLLNETRTDVVCSACISVNNAAVGEIGNEPLIDKLLQVLYAMEIL